MEFLRRTMPLLIVSLLVFSVTGCKPEDREGGGVDVTWSSHPTPLRVGEASILVEVSDTLAQAISGVEVTIEANMTHPGMRPVFTATHEIEPGLYMGHLEFSMQGEWFMEATGYKADGSKFVRVFRFSVLASEE